MHSAPHGLPESLDAPTIRALIGAGYTTLTDLTHATEEGILALHGVGPKVIPKLEALMAAEGPSFASARGVR